MTQLAWTARQAADFHSDAGTTVVEKQGVLWLAGTTGFYRPVDFLRPLPKQPWPRLTAIGYHHITTDAQAQTFLPLKLIEDLDSFSEQRWSTNMRRDLRVSGRRAEIEQAGTPDLLLDQGFEVWRNAARRTGQQVPQSERDFGRLIAARWRHGPQIALVGHRDGRLGGFFLAHVIGDAMYVDHVVLSDEGLRWCLAVGLYWRALTAAPGMGANTAFVGFWEPELPGLEHFKHRIGARIVPTAARASFRPPVGTYLRKHHPLKSRRLAGLPTREAVDALGDGAAVGAGVRRSLSH